MTEQELLDRYGHIKLKLVSYYKYSFTFKSDDGRLVVFAGGDKDDIYRLDIEVDRWYLLKDLPLACVRYDGQEVYSMW